MLDWLCRLSPTDKDWPYEHVKQRVDTSGLLAEAVDVLGIDAAAWGVEAARFASEHVQRSEETSGFSTRSSGRVGAASESALLGMVLALARGGFSSGHLRISDDLNEVARIAFRQGVGLDILINRIWGIYTVAKDQLLASLPALVPATDQHHLIREISAATFDYANTFVRAVGQIYEHESRAWRSQRSEEQQRIIDSVLQGGAPPATENDLLDMPWDGGHLYAIGWADERVYVPDRQRAIDDFAAHLAHSTRAHRYLTREYEGLIHFWWTYTTRPAEQSEIQLLPSSETWLRLAVGPAAVGVEGFRSSYLGASHTARLSKNARVGSVWRYDDVGHFALMMADPDAAARFVFYTLGPLTENDPRTEEIRETLRLYLAHRNSRNTVAQALHIAPNTVAYRVGQADEMLNNQLQERSQQILLALQLLELVPDLLRGSLNSGVSTL